MQCVGCGQKVEDSDKSCPNCGRESPTSIRVFGIPIGPGFAVIVMALAIYYFFF